MSDEISCKICKSLNDSIRCKKCGSHPFKSSECIYNIISCQHFNILIILVAEQLVDFEIYFCIFSQQKSIA